MALSVVAEDAEAAAVIPAFNLLIQSVTVAAKESASCREAKFKP